MDGSQFAIFPKSNEKNRELQTFYSRNITTPIINNILQPDKQIENFPLPEQNIFNNKNTNVMFSKIEEERQSENTIHKPKPIDFTLPVNTKQDINHENNFQELMKNRDLDDLKIQINNPTVSNKIKKKDINDIISKPKNQINKEILNDYNAIQSENIPFIEKVINTNNSIDYNSIIDGLDENLLLVDEIIDKPDIKHIIEYKSTILKNNKSSFDKETEQKNIYLTILSKYRNINIYPSPTNFTLPLVNPHVKILNNLFFKNNDKINDKNNDIPFNIDKIKNILSIECLDVIIPKNNFILQEPYLWLCINEWGSSNIGTGVPNNAFARLKPIPIDKESPYITMRPHILERQTPASINDKITCSILTSDGESFDIDDKMNINNIIDEDVTILEINNINNIKENDLIYLYSLYNEEIIDFYPNIYIDILSINNKLKNLTMTLRLFYDKDTNILDNKIKQLIDNKNLEFIVSNYLSNDDLLFLEINGLQTNIFKILNIENNIITIQYSQNEKKNIKPKKITKIGFIKKRNDGYQSSDKKNLTYKGGVIIKKIQKSSDNLSTKIYLNNKYIYNNNSNNKYFFLQRNKQISYMFRITYLE